MAAQKGWTIFKKLLGIFMLLTVSIGLTWIVTVVFFYQRSDRASTAHSMADEINIWMLQARRNEKDFQLRDIRTADFYQKGTGDNLSKHGVSMAGLLKTIDALDALHQVGTRRAIEDLRAAVQGIRRIVREAGRRVSPAGLLRLGRRR